MNPGTTASVRTVLFVSHDMGGGVQRHIEQLQELLAGKAEVAILLSQPGSCVKLSFGSDTWYFDQLTQFDELLDMLRAVQVSYLHIHHLSGLENWWRHDRPIHGTTRSYSEIRCARC